MTADVIDMRTDTFLRVLRETGDWNPSCERAGISIDEISKLCSINIKFDRAQVECQLENLEETMLSAIDLAAKQARVSVDKKMTSMRKGMYDALRARHGVSVVEEVLAAPSEETP